MQMVGYVAGTWAGMFTNDPTPFNQQGRGYLRNTPTPSANNPRGYPDSTDIMTGLEEGYA